MFFWKIDDFKLRKTIKIKEKRKNIPKKKLTHTALGRDMLTPKILKVVKELSCI
jgi:hypothetical protein